MSNNLDVSQAAQIILADMMRLDISFGKAWDEYNSAWHDNMLLGSDKDSVARFISEIIDNMG